MQKAEKGDINAQNSIGNKYLYGLDGVEIDGEKAVYWLKKAAAKNNLEAVSILKFIYREGKAGIKKKRKASSWRA